MTDKHFKEFMKTSTGFKKAGTAVVRGMVKEGKNYWGANTKPKIRKSLDKQVLSHIESRTARLELGEKLRRNSRKKQCLIL